MKGRGKELESEIEGVLHGLEVRGIACIKKIDPPSVTFGTGSQSRTVLKRNPFLDFSGTAIISGKILPVMMEAKKTSAPRMPFGEGGLSDDQIEAIRDWSAWGWVCFVLWSFDGDWRIVTWQTVRTALRSGRKSVPVAWIDPVSERNEFLHEAFLKINGKEKP